jgi:hypothetical protein
MLHLRRLALCWSISLLIAVSTAAQVPQNQSGEVQLSATQSYSVLAPPNTAATLIPFNVAVEGRDDEGFDVSVANAGAVVSLILPDGTEVNSINAASLGFGFDVIAADSAPVTSGLFTSFLSLSGTHTLIRLPTTSPAGAYQIKVNTSSVAVATPVYASYLSGSPIRAALSTDATTYNIGETVVLSAFIFNGTSPVTNATIIAAVADQEHPSTPPVQIALQDSGPNDAAQGDGIYTGVYTTTAAGKFLAAIRATGTSSTGAAYARTAGAAFRVLPSLAGFNSFTDAGIDDNGNGLLDRVAITAIAQVQRAGNYRLELSLAASNGSEARANATTNLLTGVQQMTASFSATQVKGLGVDGPYTIKNATLLYVDDPEEPVAAFRENGGLTLAYALSSLERPALKFTGNNTVTGIDTNGNGKFELLRVQVEVNAITASTYNWSGTLKDVSGREIQALDGMSAMSAGNNNITFDFDGIKIAQHGIDGPYALNSVLVFNSNAAANVDELLRTQAFSVNDFECAGAPALALQSVTLTPSSIIGGNATTLHVNLAEAAGACGSKVTITSDNPALVAAALPATLIIPAGQSSADVTIITSGVASTTQVNLTATSGASSQSAALTVAPSSLANLSLSPAAVLAGETTSATVELDGAAPSGGYTVSLSSGNSGVASVPASVVIPAGERSVAFAVNTNPALQGSSTVNLTATLGAVTKVTALTIYVEVYVNGSITPGGSPVTVNAAAPGQNFLLAFDGSAGQRVSLRMTDVTMSTSICCGARVSIKKPDGTYLVAPSWVGTSGAFIDTATLPVAGSYTVLIDPVEANTGSMTLTLYDVPPDFSATITPGGSPVNAAVTVPGQNARLTFDGAAGQRVSLNLNGITINNSYVSIYKPDGTQLQSPLYVGTGNVFIDALVLPSAGTYAILIDPTGYNTGNITLALYDVPPDVTGSITPGGSPVTISTTSPGQKAQLTFSGTSGQRVSLKISGVALIGGNGYVDVYLKQPGGSNLASATYISSGGGFIDVQTLPADGAYTILVAPQGMNTGSLTLALYDVPPDVTGNIASGTSLTLTLGVPGQNANVSFNAAAGQRVTLNIGVSLTGGNGYTDVFLRKPDGTTLASANTVGSGGGFINTQTLPVAGLYSIFVNPQSSNVGSVTLTMNDVSADITGVITIGGSSATVTTTASGQNARLTFDGLAGQRVSVNATSTFGGCWNMGIYKPDSSQLVNAVNCGSSIFIEPQTLPVSGTYTILIDPSGAATGQATINLYNVVDSSGSVAVGGTAASVSITTPGQNAGLTFSGTAGQRLSVNSTSNFSGCWNLGINKPDGVQLINTFNCGSSIFIEPQTLPVSGSYTLVVNPSGAMTGTATVSLYDVIDLMGAITIGGSSVSTQMNTPGQVARLAFSGAVGQRVSVNSSSTFSGCWNLGIYKPDGTQFTNTYNCGSSIFIEPQTLPTAGTYTLLIDPSGAMTGTATVRLYDVVDLTGTAAVDGASVTTAISTPGQNARLTFEGTSGQRLSVNSTSNFSGCWNLKINKPDGTQLSNTFNCGSTFVEPQTLPVSGTYTLIIDPSGAATGQATLNLYNVVDATGALTIGNASVNFTTTAPGQNTVLTFTGTAGQQVTVKSTGSTYNCVRVTLFKPDNTAMTNTFSCNSSFNLATQTLPLTGTYTILVDPSAASTGSIGIRVTSP